VRDAVKPRGEQQVLARGERAGDGLKLRHVANVPADLSGLPDEIVAGDGATARGDGQERGQHPDDRALPGAIGADQAEGLAPLHAEPDTIDSHKGPEPPGQVSDLHDARPGQPRAVEHNLRRGSHYHGHN